MINMTIEKNKKNDSIELKVNEFISEEQLIVELNTYARKLDDNLIRNKVVMMDIDEFNGVECGASCRYLGTTILLIEHNKISFTEIEADRLAKKHVHAKVVDKYDIKMTRAITQNIGVTSLLIVDYKTKQIFTVIHPDSTPPKGRDASKTYALWEKARAKGKFVSAWIDEEVDQKIADGFYRQIDNDIPF